MTTTNVTIGLDGTHDGERALYSGLALATREDLTARLQHPTGCSGTTRLSPPRISPAARTG